MNLAYKCNQCDIVAKTLDELKRHIEEKHGKSDCNNKWRDFETSEADHKLLKENYERLININKKLQAQVKDNEYAFDVQIEEF